jgi:HAD superfamily phosphatase (TIGR01681 family)
MNFEKLNNLELIIFDMDETLIDWTNAQLFPYIDVYLKALKEAGYKLAIASYNSLTEECLDEFHIKQYFDIIEHQDLSRSWFKQQLSAEKEGIYENVIWQGNVTESDNKEKMLLNILTELNIPAEKTLFFDDQKRFVAMAKSLGIKGYNVNNSGLTLEKLTQGLAQFSI